MSDDKLACEVAALRDEVLVLRQVLDELRVELGWANDNARDLPAASGAAAVIRRITSISLDPTARDFQINSVPESTVAQLRSEALHEAPSKAGKQATLF